MRINTPRILLVGKCLIGSTELRSFLEGLGTRLHFSETLAGAASLLRRWRFDVVLSQAQLPEGSARRLLRNLLTSSASFILSFRSESTYLWLPAIWNGQHCWGTLALRPSEFRAKLRELLGEPHPSSSEPWRAPAKNANQTTVISSSATTSRRLSVSCPRKQEE
jgi:hypothetical protein